MIMIMKRLMGALLLASFFSISTAMAGIEVREFNDPEQEAVYNQLMYELRCLVCQNENLAASNAELAKDLRDEVYDMITKENLGEKEVKEFLVARYGDFVLYKPPVKKTTWLLWAGPFLMLLLGVVIMLLVTRSKKKQQTEVLDDSEREQVRKLLEEEGR